MHKEDYLALLQKRAKESRAYRSFQAVGTDVADILGDRAHIALYIKIAKTIDSQTLLQTAKTVMQNSGVRNPGAYFMRIAKEHGWLALHAETEIKKPAKVSRRK
ncbi:MAG: hypothetical protein WC246_03105 [Candidatus Paceibacterota bacterium]|jgi:hypothetical protein